MYTWSYLNNIFRRKPLKIDSETLGKREFTTTILFLFSLRIIHFFYLTSPGFFLAGKPQQRKPITAVP